MNLPSEIQHRTSYNASIGLYLDHQKSGELHLELDRAGRRPSLTLNAAQAQELYNFLHAHFSKFPHVEPANVSYPAQEEVVAEPEPPLSFSNSGPTETNPLRDDGQPMGARTRGPKRGGPTRKPKPTGRRA